MRTRFAGILSTLLLQTAIGLWAQVSDSTGKPADSPVLHTGVTGRISASGLNDPQYVLSFPPVQRLLLRATQHCLMQNEIQKELLDQDQRDRQESRGGRSRFALGLSLAFAIYFLC